jgi:3-deoxy-manno-octulosonate cytidylyltransferase (CMP-KDO synthetase)
MESTRFPGKPLAIINGMPTIWHVWWAVSGARLIQPYYIATDSPLIYEACRELSMACIITSRDCRSGTERCHDAMRQLKALEGDIIINVQADEPMIRSESLDELVRAFADPTVNIASLCFAPSDPGFVSDPNRVKILIDNAGNAVEFVRIAKVGWLWKQHVGVYAYRRPILAEIATLPPIGDLEQAIWMTMGRKIRMIEIPYKTIAVDVPADIEEIEKTACPKIGPRMP